MEKEDIDLFYNCVKKRFPVDSFTESVADDNLKTIREILSRSNPYKNIERIENVK